MCVVCCVSAAPGSYRKSCRQKIVGIDIWCQSSCGWSDAQPNSSTKETQFSSSRLLCVFKKSQRECGEDNKNVWPHLAIFFAVVVEDKAVCRDQILLITFWENAKLFFNAQDTGDNKKVRTKTMCRLHICTQANKKLISPIWREIWL